jgi:hypothetical protein
MVTQLPDEDRTSMGRKQMLASLANLEIVG